MMVCNDGLFGVYRSDKRLASTIRLASLAGLVATCMATDAAAELTSLQIVDYATAPMTGSTAFPSATANSAYLARINFMADEPGSTGRAFVNDLNGPLYLP